MVVRLSIVRQASAGFLARPASSLLRLPSAVAGKAQLNAWAQHHCQAPGLAGRVFRILCVEPCSYRSLIAARMGSFEIRNRKTFRWFASSTSKQYPSSWILSPAAGTLPDT
jgi:hypothetical protein